MIRFKLLITVIVFLIVPSSLFAETKEIIAEGTYNMGDGETPSVAESRALLNAKKIALEEAGTYVESYSKVEGIILTKDEIHVLASGLMQVEILDKKRSIIGDGINFWVKIEAKVNPDKLGVMAERVKDKSILEGYENLQQAYDNSQREIEKLKKQMAQKNGPSERRQIQAKIEAEELAFRWNQSVSKGYDYIINGDFDNAISAYSSAIALLPNGEEILNELENIRKGGRLDRFFANDIKKQAPDFYKLIIKALQSRGFAYMQSAQFNKAQFNKAISDFNIVIALSPDEDEYGAYSQRGHAHFFLEQYRKAIEDLNIAISMDPDYFDNYVCRGLAYRFIGDTEKAIYDFDKAIALKPNNAHLYYQRGNAVEYSTSLPIKGRLDKAIADYNKAILLEPKYIMAYMMRGAAYTRIDQLRLAIDDYSRVIEIKPSYADAYLQRGIAYFMLNQCQNGIPDLSRAITLEPDKREGYRFRGVCYAILKNIERAIPDLKKSCDLGDDDGCQLVSKILQVMKE